MRLQEDTEKLLRTPGGEFRDLARGYDDDGVAAEQEGRELREIWFSMADALDDRQRKQVQDYIADRMQRAADGPAPGSGESSHGGHRGSPPSGGMGGMGGTGGGMGSGRSSSGSFGTDTGF